MSSKKPAQKHNSRARRRLARDKAQTGYDQERHPRTALADTVDLEALTERIGRVVEGFGLVLEEVAARGAGHEQTLSVVVDLPEDATGEVDLDTLGEVSQAVSAELDEDPDEPENPYLLEVGSPGATRRLTAPRHWKRARGRLLEITDAAGRTYLARLEETDGTTATVRRRKNVSKGQPVSWHEPETLDLADVARARVEVDFGQ